LKKLKPILLIILATIFLSSIVQPSYNAYASTVTVNFNTTFGGTQEDVFNGTAKSFDGGTVSVGYTSSSDGDLTTIHNPAHDEYNRDAIIVKYDSSGNVVWKKMLNKSDYDEFTKVIEAPDHSLLAVGYTGGDISSNNLVYAMIVKYDVGGNIIWQKVFGGTNNATFNAITIAEDGNYTVVGSSTSTDGDMIGLNNGVAGTADAIIVKYDVSGNVVWKKAFGTSENDKFNEITKTSDNNYIAVGSSGNLENGLIVKFNSIGNVVWQKSFGGSDTDIFWGVSEGISGYIVVGETLSSDGDLPTTSSGYIDAIIIKYDTAGTVLWKKPFGGSDDDLFYNICKVSSGNYLAVGRSYSVDGDLASHNNGDSDGIVIEYDETGSKVSTNVFGGLYFDSIYDVVEGGTNTGIFAGNYTVGVADIGGSAWLTSLSVVTGSGDGSDTTINGDIEATVLTFSTPLNTTFVLNPNGGDEASRFISPDIIIENKCNAPIILEVNKFENSVDSPNDFTDVLPSTYSDSQWNKLNKANSGSQIALAIKVKDPLEWRNVALIGNLYAKAVQTTGTIKIGELNPNTSTKLVMECKHGNSFESTLTSKYTITWLLSIAN